MEAKKEICAANAAVIRYNDDYVKRPIIDETFRVLNVIEFGLDNLFPQSLALISRMAPNHRGVINSKVRYCKGAGIASDDTVFEKWAGRVNNTGETLDGVIEKLLRDEFVFGNKYIEIIIDRGRTGFAISHVDATTVRLHKDLQSVIINPDWRDSLRKNDRVYPLYPVFEKIDGAMRSIMHVKEYEPEYYNYGLPAYIAGKTAAMIDWKSSQWNLTKIEKAFNISGIIFIPVKDSEESAKVMNYIKNNYTGAEARDTTLVITKSRATEGQKAEEVQVIEAGKQMTGDWESLRSANLNDLIVAHSWYRSLSGIADNTGFDTKRILNEYAIALATVIQPVQERYKSMITKLYSDILRKDIDFDFINRPPVDDGKGYYIWEIRKMKGLDYDENDPEQNKIVMS